MRQIVLQRDINEGVAAPLSASDEMQIAALTALTF
jgi:hypothetical protein